MENKQLKNLTWKYFIQNKIKEIFWTAVIIAAIIFTPYLLGNSIGDNQSAWCSNSNGWSVIEECSLVGIWGEGFLYLIGGAGLIFMIVYVLYSWFSSNWKKATKQAKKELKLNSRKE